MQERQHKPRDGCCDISAGYCQSPIPVDYTLESCAKIKRAIAAGHQVWELVPTEREDSYNHLWNKVQFRACLDYALKCSDVQFWIMLARAGMRLSEERYEDEYGSWKWKKYDQLLRAECFPFLAALYEAGCADFLQDFAPGLLLIGKCHWQDCVEVIVHATGLSPWIAKLIAGFGLFC
jgi:hypothetical protein